MGLVLEGLFALALIAAAVWLWSVRGSVTKDADDARQQAARDTQARARAQREARLYASGVLLRCLGCDLQFAGPLAEDGCPQCHLASLVVAEDEYQAGRQAARDAKGNTDGDTNTSRGHSGQV